LSVDPRDERRKVAPAEQPRIEGALVSALAEVLRNGFSADPDAARFLVSTKDETVEAQLLQQIQAPDTEHEVVVVLCRVLAERNPDRDPVYLLPHLRSVSHMNPFSPKDQRQDELALSNPSPGGHAMGFSRLRRADPVGVYSRQLQHCLFPVRMGAAVGLGDTADLTALEPLVGALSDPNWRVRMSSADSVRRLRHAGVGKLIGTHPVRGFLIKCLSDGRHEVRVAAARALGSMGDFGPVRERRARSFRSRREFDRVLRGEIPPLPRIWPGDDTV